MLRGFGPQAAVDAPRFCISTGTPNAIVQNEGRAGRINSEVYFEEGISPDTVEQLRGKRLRDDRLSCASYYMRMRLSAMGHDARTLSGFARDMFGRGQVIQKIKDKSGRTVWAAGSDPRGDGHAAAQI
jgi:gamma-glutamyltranspeptidase/glutathione hydrolase